MGSSTPWSGTEPWQAVAVDVVARWSGEPGGPASTAPAPAENDTPARRTHEDVLHEAGFVDVAEHKFPTPHTWTVDEFLGFLWSTSYTARIRQDSTLAERFETDLRARLLELEPSSICECPTVSATASRVCDAAIALSPVRRGRGVRGAVVREAAVDGGPRSPSSRRVRRAVSLWRRDRCF